MRFQNIANCGCVYHAEQGIPCEHDLTLKTASKQPQVCQHCWSKAATTSNPDLCGDCSQEWSYLLDCARKQGASPLSTALNMRNHHE